MLAYGAGGDSIRVLRNVSAAGYLLTDADEC
jgi:hypothetical protein